MKYIITWFIITLYPTQVIPKLDYAGMPTGDVYIPSYDTLIVRRDTVITGNAAAYNFYSKLSDREGDMQGAQYIDNVQIQQQ